MNKKTIIIICSSVVGFFILILLILKIATGVKTSYITYDKLEEKMIDAAEKYFNDHEELRPSVDGTYSLSYTTLSNEEYLKPINEYIKVKDGVVCSGSITVVKKETDFTYIPYINCGDEYQTKELYKQILSDNEIVTQGNGLYQNTTNNEYYFRGKVENNYVSFGTITERKEERAILWRIISIKDNYVKLRMVEKYDGKSNWDDRYNVSINKNSGYNDFETSIFKDFLKSIETDNKLLSVDNMAKIIPSKICIGSRSTTDTTKDGSSECSVLSTDDYYFSSLLPYEYMRASLDENCTTLDNKSCRNLNYLYLKNQETEWTTIKDPTNDYNVYMFDGTTYESSKAKQKKVIYPVITLNNYAFYSSGTGTENDPYLVK